MKVKLMLDTKEFTKKPNGYETSEIQKRIKQTEIEIEELAIGLCNGMTCKPALLNGTKSVDWVQQEIFMLDFDHDTSINEELENCKQLNIMPAFLYTSFSHSEQEHHFRMVFISDKVISDVDTRNKLQSTLINTFFKTDKVTFDCTRIFYGGNSNSPIVVDYNNRINANDIINRYYKMENEVLKPTIMKRNNNDKSNNKSNNKHTPNDNYMLNVEAIKSLNVNVMKSLLNIADYSSEVLMCPNKEDINNLILSGTHKTLLHSEQEVYDFINSIDMYKFLNISQAKINCILPNHQDSSPSAHIYITDSGTQVYKCFGCNKSRTLIGLVEELAKCKRHEAIEFIKSVYNIELVQSDWVLKQKQIMIESANYLDGEEFRTQFPNIEKLIRTRKLHIQKMLLHFTQHVTDDLQYNDKALFYSSYTTLTNVCGISTNRSRTFLSQSITLFTLLNMLNKVELNHIPENELKKAKSISAKYGFKKLTNFYQFEEYGVVSLEESEEIAGVLLDNNMSLRGLSREYILRTFGTELADKTFPQYTYENKRGTSDKSNNVTLNISQYLLDKLNLQGYIIEKELKVNNETETQWKKSIQEILNSYNLKRVRLNKELKEQFNIDCNGYPFIIISN